MSDFLCITTLKAVRKPRGCYWCETSIPQGAAAVKVTGVWDGDFGVLYLHPECNDAWHLDPCNLDGEACPYHHARGQTCSDASSEPPLRRC